MGGILQILSIALIYCGTVFGAGFASGKEVVQFFSSFGVWGIFFSLAVGLLFSVFGGYVCYSAKKYQLTDIKDYLSFLFPKPAAILLYGISTAFLTVTFCIMITGSGALFYEQFGLPPVTGALVTLGLCFVIMKEKVAGLARLNAVLTPFLCLGVTVLAVLVVRPGDFSTVQTAADGKKAAVMALLYLSFNLMSATAVLVLSAKKANTPANAGAGGALGGVLVAIPLVLLTAALAQNEMCVSKQLPFFALICAKMPQLRHLCALILYSAMLTTAASAGASVVLNPGEKPVGKRGFWLCVLAFGASFLPFGTLVFTMYSSFGVCGVVFIYGILKSILKKQEKLVEKIRK